MSNSPDGVPSKSIAPGAEPIWLSNSREFLYDIDPSRAAVFSLSTMSYILLPDSGRGGHRMIAAKAASRKGNVVALLLVDEKSEWWIAVHEGASFDHRRTLPAYPGRYLQFDGADRLLIPEKSSPLRSTLVSVDWRRTEARRIGAVPGLEIVGAEQGSGSMLLFTRRLSSDAWLYQGGTRQKMTADGRTYPQPFLRVEHYCSASGQTTGPSRSGVSPRMDGPSL